MADGMLRRSVSVALALVTVMGNVSRHEICVGASPNDAEAFYMGNQPSSSPEA